MRNGFSLVELSIVLVILGLLVGGILAGQSLIRASELRSVTTELARFVTATHTFRDKYFGLPGDITNATKIWAAVAGTSADNWTTGCYSTYTAGVATCNGDGDGRVGWLAGASDGNERYRYWQHLANAGLIEGTYNGDAAGDLVASGNVPGSKLNGNVWVLNYMPNYAGSVGYLFAGDYGHMLQVRHPGATMVNMKPEEAWNIDTKLDDGQPSNGKIFALYGTTFTPTSCVTASGVTDRTATYNLSDNGKICELFFLRVF